jgi:hypothetical protein
MFLCFPLATTEFIPISTSFSSYTPTGIFCFSAYFPFLSYVDFSLLLYHSTPILLSHRILSLSLSLSHTLLSVSVYSHLFLLFPLRIFKRPPLFSPHPYSPLNLSTLPVALCFYCTLLPPPPTTPLLCPCKVQNVKYCVYTKAMYPLACLVMQ